nr:agmatine deiminase family protein [Nesterenkonia sp. NBAIMH1]
MPSEWEPHECTWMAFPPANETFGAHGSASLQRARQAWANVAAAVCGYEPVRMMVRPEDIAEARTLLPEAVELHAVPLDDAWVRDSGPTFVRDESGAVAAVDWVFNGWGAQSWAAWEADQRVGEQIAGLAGVPRIASTLVNEGGGLHVDGRGTVLLTRTVQQDPGRNPGWSQQQIEAEIHQRLGTHHAVWLPRGLTRDYDEFGTRGHVDIVACFTPAGSVLLHTQRDRSHPDHQVSRELREVLESATVAGGDPISITELPAPKQLQDESGWSDWSYINHYVANGAVIMGAFQDPSDEKAQQILEEHYPGRTVERVDARDIFAFGGGVHCITQQQPSSPTAPGAVPAP